MRNILFISLLLILTITSCSPSTATSETVITSFSSTHISTISSIETITPTISETPSQISTPWAFDSQVSPNGEFTASSYFEGQLPSGIPTIEIRDKEGKLLWQILYQGEISTYDPHNSLGIFQWSNDSAELYFCYSFSPDGGDRAFWWTGFNLQRLDMKTGEIEYVLPGEGLMSFAISPDGTQIAYTREQDQPSSIYIRDLFTGAEKKDYVLFGSKNYARVGDIHWSPSGKDIVFQTETDDYMVQTIHLNPVTMKQKVIKEYDVMTLFFDGWAGDKRVQFSEISVDGTRIERIVQVDVSSSEFIIIGTPTPRP